MHIRAFQAFFLCRVGKCSLQPPGLPIALGVLGTSLHLEVQSLSQLTKLKKNIQFVAPASTWALGFSGVFPTTHRAFYVQVRH